MADQEKKRIITGPPGFRFIITGLLPPTIATQPEAVQIAFIHSQFSYTAAFAPFVKTLEVQPLELGLDGQPLDAPRIVG